MSKTHITVEVDKVQLKCLSEIIGVSTLHDTGKFVESVLNTKYESFGKDLLQEEFMPNSAHEVSVILDIFLAEVYKSLADEQVRLSREDKHNE